MASTTNRISSGSVASAIAAACAIISWSMPSRPAVSMTTVLCSRCFASSMDRRATETGSPTPLPGSGAYTGTPACSPSTCNCCTAFGRCRSAATISGVLPCAFSQRASFAASVVLPEPCRPASMITVGGFLANRSLRASPPRIATSSSLTILMTCWTGLSAAETSSEEARAFTRAMNSLATGRATSASSRTRRISRQVDSISAADSLPLPRSEDRTWVSRSESVSNTCSRLGHALPHQCGENLGCDHAARGGIGDRAAVGTDDVEDVHGLRAERLHPGCAHVQAAFAEGTADPPQQARGVVRTHLNHGGGPRSIVDQGDLGRGKPLLPRGDGPPGAPRWPKAGAGPGGRPPGAPRLLLR